MKLHALQVIQSQFDAYNARDLERFMSHFSEDIKVYRMPATELVMEGKAAVADFYARERFSHHGLRAELLSRTVLGETVFDRERIWGVGEKPLEVMAVFEVRDGLIEKVWSFAAQGRTE